ncbi:Putative inorganic phosphate cotransporter, partial [Atta colombica]
TSFAGMFGIRHLQTLLLFLAMTIGYTLRVGMSVAVVPMANSSTANPNIEAYGWNKQEKDLVLSSFFWGYVVTQVPSGYLANVWSGQKILCIGMFVCGIFKIITPVVAHYGGLPAVLVCRVGMGLSQACLLPCIQTLLAKWAPPDERARLGTFAYAGGQFGTVIAMPIAGILAESSVGWPSIFYLFGTLSIIWSVVYYYLGADAPSNHRSISQAERMYIEEQLRTTEAKSDDEIKKKMKTPWKAMFTSVPMWALIIVHCGQNWGYWTLLTEIPSYMTGVLNFKVQAGGIFSALPYLAMWILSFPMSWFSDYALKKNVSRAVVRKVSNTVAHWGPAIALACMSLAPTDDYTWAVVILVIAVGLNAGSLCGFQINHIDLSPNFAGTMMSVTNCCATVISIIAPLISGVIVSNESSAFQWNIVFYVSAAIYFLAWFGYRHGQVGLMGLGFFCCYAIRVTTSVTLEAMTNAASANPNFEEFHWEESVKHIILSSFFWGYTITQIPASILTQRWTAQGLFSMTLVISGLLTVATPMAAHYGGWQMVIACRVMCGLVQGAVLPCLHTLLSRWSPPEERGRLSTFVYSGGWIGNVICLLSTGFLAASSIGWPSCFYIWGSLGVLSGICFYLLGQDSPSEHPRISLDEKEYIETSLGITEINEKPSTPWKSILGSLPVWALLIAQCGQSWGFWMLLTEIPSYMSSIMRFDIKKNGMMTALPYLSAWLISFPISHISDLCIRKRIVTTKMSRKICNTIGHWVPAAALIGLGYVGQDQPELAVGILVIAVSCNIAAFCGHNINHMDLSPNFAGPLMGFTNTIASACGILAPLIAGVIIKDSTNILQWRSVFFLSAAIYTVGNLIFILFGTSEVQKWNDPIESKDSVVRKVSTAPVIITTIQEKEDERIP